MLEFIRLGVFLALALVVGGFVLHIALIVAMVAVGGVCLAIKWVARLFTNKRSVK